MLTRFVPPFFPLSQCLFITLGISWNDSGVFVPLPPTPIVYNINNGQWTTQFVATPSSVPEHEPQPSGKDGDAGKIIGIVAGAVVAVAILSAVAQNVRKRASRRGLQDQQGQGQGHGQGQRHGKGKGKDLEDNSVPFAPSDQKLEEITDAGYFRNVAPQQVASSSPPHWPHSLSPPPPLTSPAYPSPPLPSHRPPGVILAPHILDILGDPVDVHQKEPHPRHDPQLFTTNTDSSFNTPEQEPRSPQG